MIAAFVLMLVLLPAFMGLFASFYIEAICRAVEARHYPDIAPARDQTIIEGVRIGVKFGILLIALNILLLLFHIHSADLFHRGMGDQRLPARAGISGNGRSATDGAPGTGGVSQNRKSGTIYLAGLMIAVVATIPLVNLLLPFLGTSMMLHVFERIRPQKDGINITISAL